MNGWAIYPTPEPNNLDNAFDWMVGSAAKHGISLKILFAEKFSVLVAEGGKVKIYYDGEECALPHFVLMRHYDYNLSITLERLGVRVVNSGDAMRLSQNKFLTHIALSSRLIPTPKTLYGENDYDRCVAELGVPFVFKAIRGSKGLEVYLVDSSLLFDEVRLLHSEYIVQSYISSSYGRDVRVWVVGDRAVSSVMRRSDSSFKSNIALGATAEPFMLTADIERLAVDSCRATGLELAGVDILFCGYGYSVCEVNGNAGFRAFGISGERVDIPDEIFSWIASQLRGGK